MKEITQAKGETSILQTGKLCYDAININVFVFVPEFKSGSISRLSPHILRFLLSVYGMKKDKENTDITTQRKCEKNYHSLLLKDKISFRKWKIIYIIFQISSVRTRLCAYIDATLLYWF